MKKGYELARLLAYVTGLVNRELLLQVEYLAAENRILRAHAPARLRLSDAERATLSGIGKRLGRKGLAQVAQVAKPETIPGWARDGGAQVRRFKAPATTRRALRDRGWGRRHFRLQHTASTHCGVIRHVGVATPPREGSRSGLLISRGDHRR